MKSSVDTKTNVEKAEFKLELPRDISIEPTYKVPLSKTKEAHIFKVANTPKRIEERGRPMVYDCYVVSSKTGKSDPRNVHFRGNTYLNFTTLEEVHEVKQWLIDTSASLNVKRRTKKTVEVDEASDDEDE